MEHFVAIFRTVSSYILIVQFLQPPEEFVVFIWHMHSRRAMVSTQGKIIGER
jgi:hypothetical protein